MNIFRSNAESVMSMGISYKTVKGVKPLNQKSKQVKKKIAKDSLKSSPRTKTKGKSVSPRRTILNKKGKTNSMH